MAFARSTGRNLEYRSVRSRVYGLSMAAVAAPAAAAAVATRDSFDSETPPELDSESLRAYRRSYRHDQPSEGLDKAMAILQGLRYGAGSLGSPAHAGRGTYGIPERRHSSLVDHSSTSNGVEAEGDVRRIVRPKSAQFSPRVVATTSSHRAADSYSPAREGSSRRPSHVRSNSVAITQHIAASHSPAQTFVPGRALSPPVLRGRTSGSGESLESGSVGSGSRSAPHSPPGLEPVGGPAARPTFQLPGERRFAEAMPGEAAQVKGTSGKAELSDEEGGPHAALWRFLDKYKAVVVDIEDSDPAQAWRMQAAEPSESGTLPSKGKRGRIRKSSSVPDAADSTARAPSCVIILRVSCEGQFDYVIRRSTNSFYYLNEMLRKADPSAVLPPLPKKPRYISDILPLDVRLRLFRRFIEGVTSDAHLRRTEELLSFLELHSACQLFLASRVEALELRESYTQRSLELEARVSEAEAIERRARDLEAEVDRMKKREKEWLTSSTRRQHRSALWHKRRAMLQRCKSFGTNDPDSDLSLDIGRATDVEKYLAAPLTDSDTLPDWAAHAKGGTRGPSAADESPARRGAAARRSLDEHALLVPSATASSPAKPDEAVVDASIVTVVSDGEEDGPHSPGKRSSRSRAGSEDGGAVFDDSAVATAASRPLWVPDEASSRCRRCTTRFSLFRRRHHCRACGHLVCASCSRGRHPVAELGYDAPVRVCDACVSQLLLARRSGANRSFSPHRAASDAVDTDPLE